jgi:hypothetical protein
MNTNHSNRRRGEVVKYLCGHDAKEKEKENSNTKDIRTGDEEWVLQYLFVLDALNYCFWQSEGIYTK